jgi:hypothetical protein
MEADIFFVPSVYFYKRMLRNRRKAMQRRYCSCGSPVLVEYRHSGRSWTTIFRAGRLFFRFGRERCPRCGRALHIDDLS